MQTVRAFDQLGTVLSRAALPVTLRFRSREKETPVRVDECDVAHSYDFTWDAHTSLGVSLAMDPCSLYAVITMIDPAKISPALQALRPVLGDVLVAVSPHASDGGHATRLDEMRFEDIIRTLRQFPRPCRLSFARLVEETVSDAAGTDEDRKPLERLKAAPGSSDSNGQYPGRSMSRPPFLKRSVQRPLSGLKDGIRPARKLVPMSNRQSFRIDKPVPSALSSGVSRLHAGSTCSNEGRPHRGSNADDDKGFYTVMYSGGAVGLQLRDCSEDDKHLAKGTDKTNRTNGCAVAIRSVTDVKSAHGLELATADDLLMAIGSKDLQHMSFEDVRKELGRIQTPTRLLFKKRRRVVGNSVASSLVDTLLLFLM